MLPVDENENDSAIVDSLVSEALANRRNLVEIECMILEELQATWRQRCRGALIWIAYLYERATGTKPPKLPIIDQDCQDFLDGLPGSNPNPDSDHP